MEHGEHILDRIIRTLPKKWQIIFIKVIEKIFIVYYTIKHHNPYTKAKHRIAYHKKFKNSNEYRSLCNIGGSNFAEEYYFEEARWKEYIKHINFKEKLKCFFLPYSIIYKYNED